MGCVVARIPGLGDRKSASVLPSPPTKVDLPALNRIFKASKCAIFFCKLITSSCSLLLSCANSCSSNWMIWFTNDLFSLINVTTLILSASSSFKDSASRLSADPLSFFNESICFLSPLISSLYLVTVDSEVVRVEHSFCNSSLSCVVWDCRKVESWDIEAISSLILLMVSCACALRWRSSLRRTERER